MSNQAFCTVVASEFWHELAIFRSGFCIRSNLEISPIQSCENVHLAVKRLKLERSNFLLNTARIMYANTHDSSVKLHLSDVQVFRRVSSVLKACRTRSTLCCALAPTRSGTRPCSSLRTPSPRASRARSPSTSSGTGWCGP